MVNEYDDARCAQEASVMATLRNGMPVTAYSGLNRAEAVQDAAAVAGRARDQCLSLRYTVVRIATEEVF